jgi:DNA adenine methylase
MGCAPFLKWVGGKRQLLLKLRALLPRRAGVGRYYEPFIGGGALFFDWQPHRAALNDINPRLVAAYQGVKIAPGEVVERLKALARAHSPERYLEVRDHPPDDRPPWERAAWLIYLNRAGFNGLYRENSRGQVNVAVGSATRETIASEGVQARILAASLALTRADIGSRDAIEATVGASAGDVVYDDPPYVPLKPTSFTSYTGAGYTLADHRALEAHRWTLAQRGVQVVVSNHLCGATLDIYAPERWRALPVKVTRQVSTRASTRGPRLAEVLLIPITQSDPAVVGEAIAGLEQDATQRLVAAATLRRRSANLAAEVERSCGPQVPLVTVAPDAGAEAVALMNEAVALEREAAELTRRALALRAERGGVC